MLLLIIICENRELSWVAQCSHPLIFLMATPPPFLLLLSQPFNETAARRVLNFYELLY